MLRGSFSIAIAEESRCVRLQRLQSARSAGLLPPSIDGLFLSPFRIADVDLPRLHRLGNFAHQLDRQQPVLQVRAAHLDVIGERKPPLERAVRNAAVDVVVPFSSVSSDLRPRDDQHVLLGGDVDLIRLEASDGELDTIIVFAVLIRSKGG